VSAEVGDPCLHHGALIADVDDPPVRDVEVVANRGEVVGELRHGRIDLRAGGGEGNEGHRRDAHRSGA